MDNFIIFMMEFIFFKCLLIIGKVQVLLKVVMRLICIQFEKYSCYFGFKTYLKMHKD